MWDNGTTQVGDRDYFSMSKDRENFFRSRRDFKGLWIPVDLWMVSPDILSVMEKVIFAEIMSLDNEDGCYAGNAHFATFFGVSERQIRTYLASLKDKGLISIELKNNNTRVIRANGKFARLTSPEIQRQVEEIAKLLKRTDR